MREINRRTIMDSGDGENASVKLLGEVVEEKGVLTARSWQDLTGTRKNPHHFDS